jgi:hypothetical protein
MQYETNKPLIMIRKASGQLEAFNVEKLKASLKNAGAADEEITSIVDDISQWVYDGLSTKQIYARAYSNFKRLSKAGASHYKLKTAIMEMGPSGHPFEVFIGEVFKHWGYTVRTALVMQGASVTHEMDVLASQGNELILVECKFSVKQGNSVSVQVPLYVHSRVEDIVEKLREEKPYKDSKFVTWIVTNSRFTPDSVQYSRCKGIQLMGWDHPKSKALKDVIENEKIFPITVLSSLSKADKTALLADGIVTCKQIRDSSESIKGLNLSRQKLDSLQKELEALT